MQQPSKQKCVCCGQKRPEDPQLEICLQCALRLAELIASDALGIAITARN